MRAVLFVLVVFMIGKDVSFAPFPHVLRGAAQMLCFAAGLVSILPLLSIQLLSRYWPVLSYLLVLLFTAPFTPFPVFVLLQVLSLISAVMFAIAYFERQHAADRTTLMQLTSYTVLTYGVLIISSLALARLLPALAYDDMFIGAEAGYELRFRGIFSNSPMMGAAAGLLVGLTSFYVTRWPLRLALVVPGLLCLALTQSRSFWVAALAAGGMTAWLYYPRLRNWIYACFGVVVLVVAIALSVKVDTSSVDRFARLNSVRTLTGRTALWQAALNSWSERPWLGQGFTLGGSVLADDRALARPQDPAAVSRRTLHNGYIQSLMDAGLVGSFFYAMSFLTAIGRVIRYDFRRRYPEALYVLLFLSIANGGESVVYSGSNFPSLCFWVFAVFAMSLLPRGEGLRKADLIAAPSAAPRVVRRPQNLMP